MPNPPGARRLARAAALLLWLAVPALALWLAVPALASEYGRPLFQWSDEAGAVRYTTHPNRVPPAHQDTLRPVTGRAPAVPTTGSVPGGAPGGVGVPGPGGAATPRGSGVDVAARLAEIDHEIATLEARIARDQEILKTLISDPEAAPDLSASADLAEIAQRLPEWQAELEALRAKRARAAAGDGG